MILVVDTGPLVAAFNKKDRVHEACAELLATTSARLVVPAPVVTEVCYLIETRKGTRTEAAFLPELARDTMTLESTTTSDLARMAELVTRYGDLPLGGVDASVIAIAERLDAVDIATLSQLDRLPSRRSALAQLAAQGGSAAAAGGGLAWPQNPAQMSSWSISRKKGHHKPGTSPSIGGKAVSPIAVACPQDDIGVLDCGPTCDIHTFIVLDVMEDVVAGAAGPDIPFLVGISVATPLDHVLQPV